jgi:hypothetical protein
MKIKTIINIQQFFSLVSKKKENEKDGLTSKKVKSTH